VPPGALVALVCGLVVFGGRQLLGAAAAAGGGLGAEDGFRPEGGDFSGSREARTVLQAYKMGYKDGKEGLEMDPPEHYVPARDDHADGGGADSGGGGGFGMYKLFRYGMVANTVYRLGQARAGGPSSARAPAILLSSAGFA
jgi:hypothetical protein